MEHNTLRVRLGRKTAEVVVCSGDARVERIRERWAETDGAVDLAQLFTREDIPQGRGRFWLARRGLEALGHEAPARDEELPAAIAELAGTSTKKKGRSK